MSIAYVCPYRNPTATMGHAVHNVDISKPLSHTKPSGIHPWRAHFSSVSVAIKGQHLPTEVCYNAKLQSGEDPGEDDEHADELPWRGLCTF